VFSEAVFSYKSTKKRGGGYNKWGRIFKNESNRKQTYQSVYILIQCQATMGQKMNTQKSLLKEYTI